MIINFILVGPHQKKAISFSTTLRYSDFHTCMMQTGWGLLASKKLNSIQSAVEPTYYTYKVTNLNYNSSFSRISI